MTVRGEMIKKARLAAGMSQMALSQAAGVSERNIVRWETGKNSPRADHLAAIAKATGQSIDYFYSGGQEVPAPPGEPFRDSDGTGRGAVVAGEGTA